MSDLGERIACSIGEATFIKTTQVGLDNTEKNRKYFGKTIGDLRGIDHSAPEGSAIVIVGGPSLHRKDPVAKILASGFKGDIIAADGALGYCLRSGLVPHYVITVDPHPYRIVRWFGETKLETRPEDDYFSRQDLDPEHGKDQVRYNRELIELVNRHGKEIKAIISSSVDISVTERCVESGMDLYWWNPLYDDYERPNSITKRLFDSTHIPCMVTGGNVGTAAWVFAHSVLKRKHVALMGMDLGYAPDTPLPNTQYYKELLELFGDRVADAYIQMHNPYLNETWYTDPTYYWYRSVFLELAQEAQCITYNCTEGGTLFGESIHFVPLDDFLAKSSMARLEPRHASS